MLFVEMRSGSKTNEELASICVLACIGHGEHTLVSVRVPYLLISKFIAVDRNTSSTVSGCSVTTLRHEAANDSMELVAFIVKAFAFPFTSANGSKIFTSFGDIFKKFEHNA